MCKPKTPSYTPPPAPPEPPKAPRMVDAGVIQARDSEADMAKKRAGRTGTVLTNPTLMQGAVNTAAGGKQKLGQ